MAYVNNCDCCSPVPNELARMESNIIAINNNPPYPDSTGYWMIYNPTKRKYELSDIKVPTYNVGLDVSYVDGGDSTDFKTGVFDDTLKSHIQIRADIESNWKYNNPVLELGEFALTTDNNNYKFKIGNGVTAWRDLDYFSAVARFTNPILLTQDGVCTWTVSHGLNSIVGYNIVEAASGEDVMATVIIKDANTLLVKIKSSDNISAGKYRITVTEVNA